RVPAGFCGIVGLRPTPGLIPNHPLPLAWDPGQVHGPLARSAEDAALMLDAMVQPGCAPSPLSPISVAPPWHGVRPGVARASGRGLRVAYAADIAGIGVDREIDAVCAAAARRLADAGAKVETIAFDVSEGRAPYLAWRGAWMVGQQYRHLANLAAFGDN